MSATAEEILTVRGEFEREHERTVREEIERFRARAEELLAGNITEDEFRSFRLRFGNKRVDQPPCPLWPWPFPPAGEVVSPEPAERDASPAFSTLAEMLSARWKINAP